MSGLEPWLDPGYGDVQRAERDGSLIVVTFANGDVVRLDPGALGIAGEFSVAVAEGGAAVLIAAPAGQREIDWMVVRASSDPGFAQELRDRDAAEARRVGRRLRALRENLGMSQKALAAAVNMKPPQLAKLEQGESDLRVSTLRSLLRALGATFADIAGPDAPEVSASELRRRAQAAGVPGEVIKRIAAKVDRRELAAVVGRAFQWDPDRIVAGALPPPAPRAAVVLKQRSKQTDSVPALLALAEALARRSALAFPGAPGTVPPDPAELRGQVLEAAGELSLEALVSWCWQAGVIVVPMQAAGGFSAGAWLIGAQPVVVLKESPDLKPHWLFALAHELGHLARRHVSTEGLVDLSSGWKNPDDAQEQEANAYALDLLVPGHQEMLEEIRRRSASDPDGTFKPNAIDLAKARGYNPAVVLLVAAFGLPGFARDNSRWGSANNVAKEEGPARALVAAAFGRHVELGRLDRLDALLLDALALG